MSGQTSNLGAAARFLALEDLPLAESAFLKVPSALGAGTRFRDESEQTDGLCRAALEASVIAFVIYLINRKLCALTDLPQLLLRFPLSGHNVDPKVYCSTSSRGRKKLPE